MSDIDVGALGRSASLGGPIGQVGNRKEATSAVTPTGDSVQLSDLPDLTAIEQSVEQDFQAKRAALHGKVEGDAYPPLKTIESLSRLFASDHSVRKGHVGA